jgi:hypothetical protein
VGDGHPPPHVLGYGLVGGDGIRRSSSSSKMGVRGRMRSSSFRRLCLTRLSASGPRMHDYAIRAGALEGPLELLLLLLLRQRLWHSRCRAWCLELRHPAARMARVLRARRAVKVRVRTSMVMKTLILTAVVFIVSDHDKSRISKLMSRVIWMRREVVSVRPIARVRWDEHQEDPVQGGVGVVGKKRVHHNDQQHHRDAFRTSNVYVASAAAWSVYGHALSSSYSSTGSVEYSLGYGVGVGVRSYGARRVVEGWR